MEKKESDLLIVQKVYPAKSALDEYKAVVNPKSKMDKSKLLMSSSKNFTSKQKDPQLERNRARLMHGKHLL